MHYINSMENNCGTMARTPGLDISPNMRVKVIDDDAQDGSQMEQKYNPNSINQNSYFLNEGG